MSRCERAGIDKERRRPSQAGSRWRSQPRSVGCSARPRRSEPGSQSSFLWARSRRRSLSLSYNTALFCWAPPLLRAAKRGSTKMRVHGDFVSASCAAPLARPSRETLASLGSSGAQLRPTKAQATGWLASAPEPRRAQLGPAGRRAQQRKTYANVQLPVRRRRLAQRDSLKHRSRAEARRTKQSSRFELASRVRERQQRTVASAPPAWRCLRRRRRR